MTELERALVRLGDELAFPAAPDVSARVLARVAEPPPRRRRRALVLVLAVLAVAIGAAFAVPQARTAILELLPPARRDRASASRRCRSFRRGRRRPSTWAAKLEPGRARGRARPVCTRPARCGVRLARSRTGAA